MRARVLILMVLAVTPLLALEEEPEVPIIRVDALTIHSTLKAVEPVQGGYAAVGEGGHFVSYSVKGYWSQRLGDIEMTALSCKGLRCVAAGEEGEIAVIDLEGRSFRIINPIPKEVEEIALLGKAAAILYRGGGHIQAAGELIVIDLEDGRVLYIRQGAVQLIKYKDVVYVLLNDGKVYTIASVSQTGLKIHLSFNVTGRRVRFGFIDGEAIIASDGTIRRLDGTIISQLKFEKIRQTDETVAFISEDRIWLLEANGPRLLALLPWRVEDIDSTSIGFVAVGEDGRAAIVDQGEIKLLTAPSIEYSSSESLGDSVIIVGGKSLLEYDGVLFKELAAPENLRDVAVLERLTYLLGTGRIWIYDGSSIKPLQTSIDASKYISMSGSSRGLILVGKGMISILEVSGDKASGQLKTWDVGIELHKASQNYAVGEYAVMIGEGPMVSRLAKDLRDVDELDGLALAVSENKNLYILTPENISSVHTGVEGTAIALRPDKAYALIGGSQGELLVYDGYSVHHLPVRLGDEIISISWLGKERAVAVTEETIYLITVEKDPKPRLLVNMKEHVKGKVGETVLLKLVLNPVYGLEGRVEIRVEGEGIPSHKGSVYLSSMYPAEHIIQIPLMNEGSSKARISFYLEGRELTYKDLVINTLPQERDSSKAIKSEDVLIYIPLAAAVFGGYIAYVKLSKRRGREEEYVDEEVLYG